MPDHNTLYADYARVFLYWADASTGLRWPNDWNQLAPQTAVQAPPGGSTVVGPIPWIPGATGNHSLYARMVTSNDPTGPETSNVGANTTNTTTRSSGAT